MAVSLSNIHTRAMSLSNIHTRDMSLSNIHTRAMSLNPHIEGPEPKFLVVLRCHINQANHDPGRNLKQLMSYYPILTLNLTPKKTYFLDNFDCVYQHSLLNTCVQQIMMTYSCVLSLVAQTNDMGV